MDGTPQEYRLTVSTSRGPIATEYLAAGRGSEVLLLHGTADSAHTWRWIMPLMASAHTLYAPSLPGFGASDKPRIDYSPACLAAFVASFLDRLGLKRVSIIGNSIGALIGVNLALRHPGRVSALALISSAGLGHEINPLICGQIVPGTGEFLTAWCKTPLGAWQWSVGLSQLLFAKPWSIPRAWYDRLFRMALLPGYLEATLLTLRAANTLWGQRESEIVLDQLHRLKMPTLVLWGDGDRIFPVRHGKSAVERLPCGRLEVLPGCGHTAQVEQPQRVAAALNRFLQMADAERPEPTRAANSRA